MITWREGVAALALFLGAFAKGLTGIGLPSVAIPVLAGLYDVRTAVILLSLPNLFTNIVLIARGWSHVGMVRGHLGLILAGVIGVLAGVRLLYTLPQAPLSFVLGVVTFAFVANSLLNPAFRLPKRVARALEPAVGLLAGGLQGSTGVSGPLLTMYLYSIGLPKEQFVFLITVLFQLFSTTQFLGLLARHVYTPSVVLAAGLSGIPIAAGFALGVRLQGRISQVAFNRFILALLTLTAFRLVSASLRGG